MRDAFGGVFTMNFLLVFLFIFVAFTAVSLNYAKAFKVKNAVIDFVEQNEIHSLNAVYINDKLSGLDSIIERMDYNIECTNMGLDEGQIIDDEKVVGYCYKGIALFLKNTEEINSINNETKENEKVATKITYIVTTKANWDLGALNKILALGGKQENSKGYIRGSWTVNGEANVVIQE